MPNSIAVLLGIALTFYIVFLIGGPVGVGLLIIILAVYFMVGKNLDSHDNRFNQIVLLSANNNKKTTGKEFNIKPIKFKDELERIRYNDANYEQKDEYGIVITNHFINDDENYDTYRVEISNNNGEALINVSLFERIARS